MKEKTNHNMRLSADGREGWNMGIALKSEIKLNKVEAWIKTNRDRDCCRFVHSDEINGTTARNVVTNKSHDLYYHKGLSSCAYDNGQPADGREGLTQSNNGATNRGYRRYPVDCDKMVI